MIQQVDCIMLPCAALCNLKPKLIKTKEKYSKKYLATFIINCRLEVSPRWYSVMVNQKKKINKLPKQIFFFKTHFKPVFHVYPLENIRKSKPPVF